MKIGINSAIVRIGVHVDDGAVIGANSLVNKDVPAFSICVGNLVKLIRYRFKENNECRE